MHQICVSVLLTRWLNRNPFLGWKRLEIPWNLVKSHEIPWNPMSCREIVVFSTEMQRFRGGWCGWGVRPELKTLFSAKDAMARHNNSRCLGFCDRLGIILGTIWGQNVRYPVDGSEIRRENQLREVGSWNPIIYGFDGFSTIPGGWCSIFWTTNSTSRIPWLMRFQEMTNLEIEVFYNDGMDPSTRSLL